MLLKKISLFFIFFISPPLYGRYRTGDPGRDLQGAILGVLFLLIVIIAIYFENLYIKYKKNKKEQFNSMQNHISSNKLPYGTSVEFEQHLRKIGLPEHCIKIELSRYKNLYKSSL